MRNPVDQLAGAVLMSAPGDTRFSEVLGSCNIGSKLGPGFGDFHLVHLEYNRSIRIGDFGGANVIFLLIEGIAPGDGKEAGNRKAGS